MEKQLQTYLTAGHAKAGDWGKLAAKLKVNRRTLMLWRQGKGYPSQGKLLRLARYTKVNQTTALLHLCQWRARGKAKRIFGELINEREDEGP